MIADIDSEDRLVQQTFAERLRLQHEGLQRHRHALRHHQALVRAAHDLLLPRLMSGEIAV